MADGGNSKQASGTSGAPQMTIENSEARIQAQANEERIAKDISPTYVPSPKHEDGHNWGSENPIRTNQEGQYLLDTGYRDGRQIYNITNGGILVKFQPDGTPGNGYHSYEISGPPDIPPSVLKQMRIDGKISSSEYRKLLKGKK